MGRLRLPRPIFNGALTGLGLFALRFSCYAQEEGNGVAQDAREIGDRLLTFIYSLGHLIGQGIVQLVQAILPEVPIPSELIDPIGLLAILTIFLAIAVIAKKLVWIVVIVGWVLVLVRITMVALQYYL